MNESKPLSEVLHDMSYNPDVPRYPIGGDLWVDKNDVHRKWDGSAWVRLDEPADVPLVQGGQGRDAESVVFSALTVAVCVILGAALVGLFFLVVRDGVKS